MSPRVESNKNSVYTRRTDDVVRSKRKDDVQKQQVRDGVKTRSEQVDKNNKPTQQSSNDALNRQRSDLTAGYLQRNLQSSFTTAPTLEQVAAGTSSLQPGQKGEGVREAQKLLNGKGAQPPLSEDGRFGPATTKAVDEFKALNGITDEPGIGPRTLEKLRDTSPQTVERKPEYDKLYEDGRLDSTMAIGFDEKGNHDKVIEETKAGLVKDGYRAVSHEEIQAMTPEQREKMGLGGDRYDPNVEYYNKTFTDPETGKEINSTVRLITPYTGGKPEAAKASFEKALREDELITYNGHGRHGSGPDFDAMNSGKGNVVLNPQGDGKLPTELRDSIKGRTNELNADGNGPRYQVLMFSSCNSDKYVKALRDKRSTGSTDALVTTRTTSWGTGSAQTLRLIEGASRRDSYNDMVRDMNKMEADAMRQSGDKEADQAEKNTYVENGTTDNRSNRMVSVQ